MLTPITVSSRDFARDQKRIIADILAFDRPVIVTYRDTPQVAVVGLKVLESIERQKELEKTRNLLKMAKDAEILNKKFKIKGPKDLSENHDKYGWGPYE